MRFPQAAKSLWDGLPCAKLPHVNRLTKQEQLVLCLILSLLVVGSAAKAYRNAHPLNAVVPENINR